MKRKRSLRRWLGTMFLLGMALMVSACQGESYNPGMLVREVTYYGAEILAPGGGRVIVPAKLIPLGSVVELTLASMRVPIFPGTEPGVARLSNYLVLGPESLVFSDDVEIQMLYADHAFGNLSDERQVLRVRMYKTDLSGWNWEKVEGTIDLTTRSFTGKTKTLGVFALFLEEMPEEIPDDTVALPDDGTFDPTTCACTLTEQTREIDPNEESSCGLFPTARLTPREDSCQGRVDLLDAQETVRFSFSLDACAGDDVLLTLPDFGECWFSWPGAETPQDPAVLDCLRCREEYVLR